MGLTNSETEDKLILDIKMLIVCNKKIVRGESELGNLSDIYATDINIQFLRYQSGFANDKKARHSYGLLFCKKGQLVFQHKDKEYISDPEHIVLLPKGESYHLTYVKGGYFVLIDFQCSELYEQNDFLVFKLGDSRQYLQSFERIQQLLLRPCNRSRILREFYDIISNLEEEQIANRDILEPVMKYMELWCGDASLDNAALAQQAHLSVPYFQRLFHKNYGITPRKYLQDMRIRKAMMLLTGSKKTITQIAEECGFTSVYHFSRAFKANTGETPTKYRRRVETLRI